MWLPKLWPSATPPEPSLETASRRLLVDRALATVIDLALCYVAVVAPVVYVLLIASPDFGRLGPVAVAASLGLLVPIYLTYSFAFEWRYSRTPGKVNRSLMVATTDGEPCTLRASAIRNLLRYVDGLGVPPVVYLVGLVVALSSDRGRRLGDRAGDTVVVRPVGYAEPEDESN